MSNPPPGRSESIGPSDPRPLGQVFATVRENRKGGRGSLMQRDFIEESDASAARAVLAGSGLSLEAAARRALVAPRVTPRNTTFEHAYDAFIRSRLLAQKKPATVSWYQDKLGRFVTRWTVRQIDSITRSEILEAIEAEPCGASTKAGLARALRALWRFCLAHEPPLASSDATQGLRVTPQKSLGE